MWFVFVRRFTGLSTPLAPVMTMSCILDLHFFKSPDHMDASQQSPILAQLTDVLREGH